MNIHLKNLSFLSLQIFEVFNKEMYNKVYMKNLKVYIKERIEEENEEDEKKRFAVRGTTFSIRVASIFCN